MDVACSTLCFARLPLETALRQIAEMEFLKADLVVAEESLHFTPRQLVDNANDVLAKIRQGPTVGFAAITVRKGTGDEDLADLLDPISHFAKQLGAPVIVIDAGSSATPIEAEIERLTQLETIVARHGTILTVTTKTGTHTEDPDAAVRLCESVPGLALTLDPSHYLCGPNQGKSYDQVFPLVRHTHLRDSGRRMDQFQVQVGRGEIEYGRIVTALGRFQYNGALTVAIEDALLGELNGVTEVRKLRLLLESLL